MAFNVSVIYKAIDQFSAPVKRMTAASNKMQEATSGLAGKGVSFQPLITGIVAVGSAAFTAFAAAIPSMMDFQDKLLELSALTGATGADLDSLKKGAMELGKQFGASGTDIMEGMKLVASAKPELLDNIPALKEVTKQVLLLSKASGQDMASASSIVAQSLNMFGLGAESAGRFVNVLAAEAKYGASEVADTGEVVIKAGVAARMAGLNFEQLTSMTESLALNGIKGSIAGTGLAATLMKMQAAGVDFKKNGVDGSLLKMKKAFEKIKNPAERTQQMVKMFGLENIDVASILMRSAGTLDAYTAKISGTGVASEQAAVRMQSLSTKWEQLKATAQEKLVMMFDEGTMTTLSNLVDKMKEQINTLDPAGLQAIGAAFGLIFTSISGIVQLIGLFVGAVVELLGLLTKAAKMLALVAAYIGSGGSLDFGAEMKAILPESQSFADMVGLGKDKEVSGEITVNVNDPKGVLKSVDAAGSGGVAMRTGQNMAGAM